MKMKVGFYVKDAMLGIFVGLVRGGSTSSTENGMALLQVQIFALHNNTPAGGDDLGGAPPCTCRDLHLVSQNLTSQLSTLLKPCSGDMAAPEVVLPARICHEDCDVKSNKL